MTDLQISIYISGFIFFIIGCYFYYLSKNENLSNDQKLNRKKVMNVFLFIALICVVYTWL